MQHIPSSAFNLVASNDDNPSVGGSDEPRIRAEVRTTSNIAGRIRDVTSATAVLILISPFLCLLVLLGRMKEGAPIFSHEHRIGAGGRGFAMLTFSPGCFSAKTMRGASPDKATVETGLPLWVGKLPQLFNVLEGSMALVGPRPALPDEIVQFGDRDWQRFRSKPGVFRNASWEVGR